MGDGASAGTGGAEGGSGGVGGIGNGGAPSCDADLMVDVDHCGACGHACLTTQCVDGECDAEEALGPVPVVIWDFVHLESHVWFVASFPNEIYRSAVPTGGVPWSVPEPRHGFDGIVRSLAHSGASIFASDTEQMWTIPTDLSTPTPLDTSTGDYKHVAHDGIRLYETHSQLGELALYQGLDRSVLLSAPANPEATNAWALVATQEFAFWTQRAAGGGVHRRSVNGQVDSLLAPSGIPTDISLFGAAVFWTDCDNGKIYRHSTTGSEPAAVVVDLPGTHPYTIDVSGDYVYWFDLGAARADGCLMDEIPAAATGAIWRARVSTREIVKLQSNVWRAEALSVVGDYVYWCGAETSGSRCHRVAK